MVVDTTERTAAHRAAGDMAVDSAVARKVVGKAAVAMALAGSLLLCIAAGAEGIAVVRRMKQQRNLVDC